MALQAAGAPGRTGLAALAVGAGGGAGTSVGGRASHMTGSASWLRPPSPASVRLCRVGAPRSRWRGPGRGPLVCRSSPPPLPARSPVRLSSLPAAIMLALISRLLDWFRSLFWKEEMELTPDEVRVGQLSGMDAMQSVYQAKGGASQALEGCH